MTTETLIRYWRTLAALSLALAFVVATACAQRSSAPAQAHPAMDPATVAAQAPQPGPAPAAAPQQAAQPPTAATPPDDEQEEGRGRGRGGPPLPPPPPPPAVMPAPPTPVVSATPPTPDPRVGLSPGWWDAGQTAWNMRLISVTPPSGKFLGVTNSDLAFTGKYAIQGNYNGFQVFDMSNPSKPVPALAFLCPASQSDVSVYKHLLFVSGEGQTGRLDCGIQGVPEPVSKDRLRGIRIFDIRDIANPKYVANVQTCRGSHTHTVVTDPNDKENVYIYVSGSSRVRAAEELPGCHDGPIDDPNTARFRIEVIKIPIADPAKAAIVSSPRIFQDLAPPPRRTEPGRGRRGGDAAADATPPGGRGAQQGGRGGQPPPRTGPNQCHDITVYPDIGLAGGACGGYGLLLDIRNVTDPVRIDAVADINMSFWHSATFSNDGRKVLFTDEWGGGSQPRCRETDRYEWGANALFTIENGKMRFHSYYKMPAPQTEFENCVAHNGSLIPIPGREVMVQGWYQGGLSVFDWTDPAKPFEIAFFDRGPVDGTRLRSGGSWSVYWYNGLIVSSEIARGLDVLELVPSGLISQNEIDAAKTVTWDYLNAQEQRQIVWPPSFALARAYLDQIERSRGLAADRIADARGRLAAAEKAAGAERRTALTRLASEIRTGANGSSDAAKVRTLADAVDQLANATQ